MNQPKKTHRFLTHSAPTPIEKRMLQVFREELQRAHDAEGDCGGVYPGYVAAAFKRTRQRLDAERSAPKKPKSMKEAIRKVANELMAMSPAEFRKLLDAHKMGDFGMALMELHEAAAHEASSSGGFYGLEESQGEDVAGQEGGRTGGLPAGGRGRAS